MTLITDTSNGRFLGWGLDALVEASSLDMMRDQEQKKHLIQYPQVEYQPLMENGENIKRPCEGA